MSDPGEAHRRSRRGTADDEPVLPDVTRDERDRGWGGDLDEDAPHSRRDADWYRRERPPHHE